jgi:hypothetical protein
VGPGIRVVAWGLAMVVGLLTNKKKGREGDENSQKKR